MSLVIRNAQPEDVEEMIAIEHICFPPAEAADAQSICERYAAFPENFFVTKQAHPLSRCSSMMSKY